MTDHHQKDPAQLAREATDREMDRRLARLNRTDASVPGRRAPAMKGIYHPPHVERRRRLFYAELAQAGVISGWGLPSGKHAAPNVEPGRAGDVLEMTHWVATPADESRPNGPRAWAPLDTRHPIMSMYRRGSLASDEATAFGRYRAAMVWDRYFNQAYGIGSGPDFCPDHVDGSGDPQAGMLARMEASMERLNVMDAPGMTERRFRDLDSVVGLGRTLTEVGDRDGRTLNAVKKSLFAGLDAVAGYARWDRLLQSVQVTGAFTERDERKKNLRQAS